MEMHLSLPLPFLVLCATILVQCQSSDQSDTTSAIDKSAISSLNADSMRRVYQQKLAEYPNLLPARQIMENNKVYPVDEAPLDTGFFLFRENLFDVISRRDVLSLLEACDKNIKSSSGGENTLPEFIEMWSLDKNAGSSKIWSILEQILRMGGVFEKNRTQFYAPYTYATFPEHIDSFTHGLITGEGVRLRERPATNAQIITNLSYDVVEKLPVTEKISETIGGEEHPWVKIKTPNGKEGWIYGKYFANPTDYRAGFEQQPNGGWQMVFLVSGD